MTKKVSIILVLMALMGLGTAAFANPTDFDRSVGLTVFTSDKVGLGGIEYTQWFDKVGLSAAGLVSYTSKLEDDPFVYLISGQVSYKLFESQFKQNYATRLTIFAQLGSYGGTLSTSQIAGGAKESHPFYADVVLGLGIGFDCMFFEHLSMPIKVGFIASCPNTVSIDFGFGTGIRYLF